MLQRVVWNTDGWCRPSGKTRDAGWAKEHGFGHEEWNFQIDDALHDEILGYIYYQSTPKRLEQLGNRFDVAFFTRDPDAKSWWIIGAWKGACLIPEDEVTRFDRWYEQRGIYTRRAREIAAAVNSLSLKEANVEARTGLTERWTRWTVPVQGVQPLPRSQWIALDPHSVGLRFRRPTFLKKWPIPATAPAPKVERAPRWAYDAGTSEQVPLAEDGYLRAGLSAQKWICQRHAMLSNALCRWLRANGYTGVRQEDAWVDLRFRRGATTYMAELKVCAGVPTRHAIREALGQLLEYNHYGWRTAHDVWWIVLDRAPNQTDCEYLARLRAAYGFEVSLAWQKGDGFEFAAPP